MPDPVPPMAGVLHRYGPAPHHLAFVSSSTTPRPPPPANNAAATAATPATTTDPTLHAILLSGLTEGLLALPYAPLLAERCASMHPPVALVQAQLGSSYGGWGQASLDGDADEVLLLMRWLRWERGSQGVVLIGHSTGCQIACRVCERHHGVLLEAEAAAAAKAEGGAAAPPQQQQQQEKDLPPPLIGVCLQAPVSDREYFFAADPQGAAQQLTDAKKALAEGEPERLIAVVEGSPLSARRAAALLERLGDDDMFSRDLTEEELRGRTSLGWVGGRGGGGGGGGEGSAAAGQQPQLQLWRRQVLVLASGADEYALPLLSEDDCKDASKVEAKLEVMRRDAERLAAAAAAGGGGGGGAVAAATIAGARHNGGGGKEGEVADAIAGLVRRAFEGLNL